jgi:hypothetical protein
VQTKEAHGIITMTPSKKMFAKSLGGCTIAASMIMTTSVSQAQSTRPTYTPGNNPCTNQQISNVTNGLANAINTALSELPPQKSESKSKTVSFSIPYWSGPFGYVYGGGNTYTAGASRTSTITGINTGTATVTGTSTSCTYTTGSYQSTGNMTSTFSWQPISLTIDAQVTGFLAQFYSGTPVKVTITGMQATAPGAYTISSTSSTNAEISAIDFSNCTASASSVSATVLGVANANTAQKIQNKINSSGPQICSSLNSKTSSMIPYTFATN